MFLFRLICNYIDGDDDDSMSYSFGIRFGVDILYEFGDMMMGNRGSRGWTLYDIIKNR